MFRLVDWWNLRIRNLGKQKFSNNKICDLIMFWFIHFPPINLHWDFRNFWYSPVWNAQFDELDFFPSLKTNWIFLPVQTGFFPSFWASVKYFNGPCLTIYSLSQFTKIYITSFWSGRFTTLTAVNQRNWNLGLSIFFHFEMTFLTTLTGILDFANLISQTGIFSQFNLGKISNWIFQTGECLKFLKSQCR